jgi:hypothetical protein
VGSALGFGFESGFIAPREEAAKAAAPVVPISCIARRLVTLAMICIPFKLVRLAGIVKPPQMLRCQRKGNANRARRAQVETQ